ncbi:hypothetical protein [Gracilibacillus saliphilus]|uniref:hypothetical protein n=1 Tax=Gracilibacillus saliphilus TaxID=543890 RepID=UPI0013D5D464|nr:hypothetical protein [Gracilibacillus saliphilus]
MGFSAYDVAIIPIITGLVQLLKNVGLPNKFSPLFALAFGILAGVFYISPNDLAEGILLGIVASLSASGLYNQAKVLRKESRLKGEKNSIS